MTTAAVPSTNPVDFLLNVETLDAAINSGALIFTDRLGNVKSTLSAAIDTIKAFTNRGAWAAATAYVGKDLVSVSGSWYVCVVAHTSSAAFSTDTSSKWRLYQGVTLGDLSASSGASMVGANAYQTQDAINLERISVKRSGAIGNGVADDTLAIQAAIDAMSSNSELVIPAGFNFNVTHLTISGKSNFSIRIDGKVTNVAAKAGGTAVDANSSERGLKATFYIVNCSNFKIYGAGSINNGLREAFCIGENLPASTAAPCTDFDISINIQGNGTNDNLHANRIRYCSRFTIKNMRVDSVGKKPAYVNNATPYYHEWVESLLFWDCSDFTVSGITSRNGAMNGIYVGSNCNRFTITDNDLQHNGASGLQLAWSSFGSFPINFTVTENTASFNRADGYDYNNTGALIECNGIHVGNRSHYNGWGTEDEAATTPTNDGSGIGTFRNIKKVIVTNNVDKECANAGGYFTGCYDFAVSENIINKVSAASLGEGLYFDTCTNMDVGRGNSVNVLATRPALKLFSATGNMNVKVTGNYFSGLIQFAGGAYVDCNFTSNKVVTTAAITTQVDFIGNTILVSGAGENGLLIGADRLVTRGNRVTAPNFGITAFGLWNPTIEDNHASGVGGIRVATCSFARVRGNYGKGTTSPGIHLLGTADNCELSMNEGESVSSNSLRVESTCTNTQKWGNRIVSGSSDFAGTYGINF